MRTITDTNGTKWQVGYIYTHEPIEGVETRSARAAQIAPGYGQINLSPVGQGGNRSGHSFPEWMIAEALNGRIRLGINK